MLTWMMQSMSTLASTEMQQQYANKMMKQQILKTRQENTKMGSTIILTNTTIASESPVEEILVAISSMMDTKTNGAMP